MELGTEFIWIKVKLFPFLSQTLIFMALQLENFYFGILEKYKILDFMGIYPNLGLLGIFWPNEGKIGIFFVFSWIFLLDLIIFNLDFPVFSESMDLEAEFFLFHEKSWENATSSLNALVEVIFEGKDGILTNL